MKTRSHLPIMSKRILSNLCFVFKPNLLLVMELINVLANPSFLASNAVVQKMITCQVIFLKVPSPFPNSFWWRVSRWFSGANHLARPVITECQQCKMTQSLIHNGKNTLVLNPLKDFVIHPDKTQQNSPLRLFNADHWVSL